MQLSGSRSALAGAAQQRVTRSRTYCTPTAASSVAKVAQAWPRAQTSVFGRFQRETNVAVCARASATSSSTLGPRHRHARTVRHVAISGAPRSSASGRLLLLRGAGPASAVAHRSGAARGRSGVAVAVSANLFARVSRIVTSFFNGLVGSFEDPEKLLDRVAEEMQEDMMRMRQATAQVMASQKQLSAKQKSMQASADQWLQRAELAVARGQDDLAREALRRRKVLQEDADRMNEQVVAQSQALEQLQANIRLLEGKLGEARSKKETLKARAASAKTSLALQEMIGGLQVRTGSSWAAFEKMEEKVAALEAQAQSAAALAAPDSLERQFAALEGDSGVDAQLAALKQARRSAAALPKDATATTTAPPAAHLAGRPLRDVFDPLEQELEELRRRAREQ
ncbi:hypothetical protein HYH02_008081 [Chlamydomonas schloesseri]|uniref:Uncharacterized protein n=1 Tax=Chlamydomonas schloesseri TaxID=2026947 RepID=A0A835WGV6_9CHLO|nr:hypothetical protein HYH02_008081 [Chlamydomonas schloesseri]|eukprot:KAG2446926.1 hypothetical protein HYH02_008081 [Chlamydomonas schloesseri]